MTPPHPKELTLTRTFNAPRELVFKAWTDPRWLAQWFGPSLFTIPHCELDPRPGGLISLAMRGPDGVDYPMDGVFVEVLPPERIVFSAVAFRNEAGEPQLETLNTITLTEENGKTKQVLHVVVTKATPAADLPLAGMEEGWSQSLEKLTGVLVKA